MMKFFAVNGQRPTRLSEATRLFAYESMNHKYGKETWENYAVSMDDYPNFDKLSSMDKYDVTVERIVKTAPIRICKNERISAAATLGIAIDQKMRRFQPPTFEKMQALKAIFE